MKTLLLLTTLALCFQLNLAKLETTTKHMYNRRTKTPPPENNYGQLLNTWNKPPPSLKKKINLTIQEYAYWTSLAKFVPPNENLQPTYVLRFCTCNNNPFGKRSLMTRVKRQDDKPKKMELKPPAGQKVRKEWRRMGEKMRKAFIKHFNNLSIVRGNETKSRLQLFADFHRESESPGAHFGPSFLPWHREYLFRLENVLTDDGYTGGLPYWNSGLDADLILARDSAIFTTAELGISFGKVMKPLRPDIVSADCNETGLGTTLKRFAKDSSDDLFSRSNTDPFEKEKYKNFSDELEKEHMGVHSWFEGNGRKSHMANLNCAPFDPLFFLHHCYIDYLWEKYREKQTLEDRENDYPGDLDIKLAFQKYRNMLPFDNMENIDGLKNQYTNVYYRYEKSPDKCKTDKGCGSALLWCYKSKCRGKIKKNGRCDRNLGDTDNQCYCARGTPECPSGDPPRCACK